MTPKKPRSSRTFYAPELTPPERHDFDRLRQLDPADEIAILRILIRRMLHTLNQVASFAETVQSVNTLSYLAGRLAKLLEASAQIAASDQAGAASDLSTSYLLSLQEVLSRFNLPPPTTSVATGVATPIPSSDTPPKSTPSSINSDHSHGSSPESPGHAPPSSQDPTDLTDLTS